MRADGAASSAAGTPGPARGAVSTDGRSGASSRCSGRSAGARVDRWPCATTDDPRLVGVPSKTGASLPLDLGDPPRSYLFVVVLSSFRSAVPLPATGVLPCRAASGAASVISPSSAKLAPFAATSATESGDDPA